MKRNQLIVFFVLLINFAICAFLTYALFAEQLFISQNTVKGHVSNILSKLHLADRTQAAVYAWKEGIVRRDS
jgi:hypothetical protein